MPHRIEVVRIGEVARAALARAAGVARPLAGFADSPYFEADREIIWVGARPCTLHPRAVIASSVPQRGMMLTFDEIPARGWSPRLPVFEREGAARVNEAVSALRRALLDQCAPCGFGTLLAGLSPGFPLEPAVPRVEALAKAYRCDDPESVFTASVALLGLGTGLTPSGDDLAGAALFGRRFATPRDRGWEDVAERLAREVEVRSHAISAALFADLARGRSFAPLHEVAEALASGRRDSALPAARELVATGHSSGWDMLTGLLIGLTGSYCDW